MHVFPIIKIAFGCFVLALAISIMGQTLIIIIKNIKGGVSHKGQRLEAEEAGMIQKIYQSLSLTEKRVDTLETLLLDRERKDRR